MLSTLLRKSDDDDHLDDGDDHLDDDDDDNDHLDLFQWKRSTLLYQLGEFNPTYERYILGPTLVNRHVSGFQKMMLVILSFLLCVYFTDQNPCRPEFSRNT